MRTEEPNFFQTILNLYVCYEYTFRKCIGVEFLLETWGLGFPPIVYPRFLLRLFHESTNPASKTLNHSNLIIQLNFS